MIKKIVCLLAGSALLAGMAGAQNSYPNRPVTLVVPFAAGGDSDLFARALVQSVQQLPSAPTLVLEHRVGKSGTVASAAVRLAPADGYTLLLARVATHAIQPAMDPSTPYKPDEFTVLAILELDPLICAVPSASPYRSARELIAAIRSAPGKLRYSTAGAGTILTFAPQYLLSMSGVAPAAAHALHFESGLQAARALAEGKADFSCAPAASVAPFIQGGQVVGLFTTAASRMATLPQLPTAREAGLRDMGQMVGWSALMAPVGLPAPVLSFWRQSLQKVAQDAAWQNTNAQLGSQPAIRLIGRPDHYVMEQYKLYRQLSLTLKPAPVASSPP